MAHFRVDAQTQPPTEIKLPLQLQEGWNLFSFPFVSSNIDVKSFFQDKAVGSLWMFDNGKYKTSNSIEPGKGYWVYLEEEISLIYSYQTTQQSTSAQSNYQSGWNLYGIQAPIPRPSEASDVMWHWTNNRFHVVPINNDLQPGKGYWINLASPSNLPLGLLDSDTDGDEIPDYWEALWQFNYNLADDMNEDPDIDNLINFGEYRAGTHPRNQDTDADGLIDGDEVNNFSTNPLLRDTDTDGLDDGIEINVLGTSALLKDTDDDGFDDGEEVFEQSNPLEPGLIPLTRIESSPSDGENGVALTRETIIRFTRPLANSVEVDNEVFYAEFGGELLSTRIHVGSNQRTMTLFYDDNLPPSSRIRVTIKGDNLLDDRNIPIDVDGDGVPGGIVNLDFETLNLTTIPSTAVCGRVFASELMAMNSEEEAINQPLEGVTITVDGMEDTLKAITDNDGNFRLEPVPSGRFFVHIDGRTVKETL